MNHKRALLGMNKTGFSDLSHLRLTRLLLLVSGLLLFSQAAVTGDGDFASDLSDRDLQVCQSIRGLCLRIDQPVESIPDDLGSFEETVVYDHRIDKWDEVRRVYDGIVVQYQRGFRLITRIVITDPNWETDKGISVGDHLESVYRRYGRYTVVKRDARVSAQWEDSRTALIRTTYYLSFYLTDEETVVSIDLGLVVD